MSFDNALTMFDNFIEGNLFMSVVILEYLKDNLSYQEDGGFIWIKAKPKRKVGTRAGSTLSNGYRYIGIDGNLHQEHRLVYFWHNPDWDINPFQKFDHINGIKDDNRIENLKLFSIEEGKHLSKNAKGFQWHKPSQKWLARIRINGTDKFIGFFDSSEKARLAYEEAERNIKNSGF